MEGNITAHDVASLAGVSQSTVSRVFTEGARVSDKSRRKVLQAAEQLGYRPNEFARSLIMRKSRLIGLVMKGIDNPFYPLVMKKFAAALKEIGYNVLLVDTNETELQPEDIDSLLAYQVAGVIITDATASLKTAETLGKFGIPAVLFNRVVPDVKLQSVSCDNMEAAKEIARYLIETGSRTFAYIGGGKETSTNAERMKGFTEELERNGYNCAIANGEFTYEGGLKAANALVKGTLPDAVFAANDIMALGALDAFKKSGIEVPRHVRLIGFDNIPMTSWEGYQLSTYLQPIDEMIQMTIRLLLDELTGIKKEQLIHYIPGKLLLRETT